MQQCYSVLFLHVSTLWCPKHRVWLIYYAIAIARPFGTMLCTSHNMYITLSHTKNGRVQGYKLQDASFMRQCRCTHNKNHLPLKYALMSRLLRQSIERFCENNRCTNNSPKVPWLKNNIDDTLNSAIQLRYPLPGL